MVEVKPTERERDRDRKAAKRQQDRDLRIPRIADPERRRACLADIYQFLPTYFPEVFFQPFTEDRREMIDAILHAAKYGGDQAVAGPRADGKTRSALFGSLSLVLAGFVFFPMLISKSGPRAHRELKNLKEAIEASELFAADFPEICAPIHALQRWSSRARQQTAYGRLTNMEWGEELIIFPTIPTALLHANGWNEDFESAARGQIIASLGIEGAIRGYSVRNRRPDLALLDDIDDRESARSETQTDTRVRIIEEDIGGLAGPDRTISRVMLCTLINRTCVAATFTDREKKPSWRGQRHRLLLEEPENTELWQQYVELRKGRAADDPDAREAHAFYLANREAMDAGAVVTNPYRFDSRTLLDGSQAEVSALQACFNIIADRSREHFDTEYQNDPPEDSGLVERNIGVQRICRQLSGLPRQIVPDGCTKISAGVDVGKSWLHWVVRAWKPDGTGYTIDYGANNVLGVTAYMTDEALDIAILAALNSLLEDLRNTQWMNQTGGELRRIDLGLIDSRFRYPAVDAACLAQGVGWHPVIGHGKSAGCATPSFSNNAPATKTRRPGDGWFETWQETRKVWLVNADTDRWKGWEHDRWLTSPDKPGCMFLFGEDPGEHSKNLQGDQRLHVKYAEHICAEVEVEETVDGVTKRKWKMRGIRESGHRGSPNHWFDASCYADLAGAMLGIRVISQRQAPRQAESAPTPGRVRELRIRSRT